MPGWTAEAILATLCVYRGVRWWARRDAAWWERRAHTQAVVPHRRAPATVIEVPARRAS